MEGIDTVSLSTGEPRKRLWWKLLPPAPHVQTLLHSPDPAAEGLADSGGLWLEAYVRALEKGFCTGDSSGIPSPLECLVSIHTGGKRMSLRSSQ